MRNRFIQAQNPLSELPGGGTVAWVSGRTIKNDFSHAVRMRALVAAFSRVEFILEFECYKIMRCPPGKSSVQHNIISAKVVAYLPVYNDPALSNPETPRIGGTVWMIHAAAGDCYSARVMGPPVRYWAQYSCNTLR
jgi:hypothetical protein